MQQWDIQIIKFKHRKYIENCLSFLKGRNTATTSQAVVPAASHSSPYTLNL